MADIGNNRQIGLLIIAGGGFLPSQEYKKGENKDSRSILE